MKKISCFLLRCILLPVCCLWGGCTNNTLSASNSSVNQIQPSADKVLEGRKISILGDSNASFDGISNSTEINSTLGNNYSYFPRYDVQNNDETWWALTAKTTDTQILVNNSSSGAKASGDRFDNGWFERCLQLHGNRGKYKDVEPDIILVRLGENDFHGGVPYGGFKTLSDIWTEETGYKTPQTYTQALAIIVHKMLNRYKKADIFIFTLTYRQGQNEVKYEIYNDCIRLVAEYFGVNVIEWYGYSDYDPQKHTGEGVHFNQEGMKLMAECVTNTLVSYYEKN